MINKVTWFYVLGQRFNTYKDAEQYEQSLTLREKLAAYIESELSLDVISYEDPSFPEEFAEFLIDNVEKLDHIKGMIKKELRK